MHAKTTEVVDLSMTNSMCSFGQLPYPKYGSVGGMLGHVPILCGGSNGHRPTNDPLGICFIYFNFIYDFSSFHNLQLKSFTLIGATRRHF